MRRGMRRPDLGSLSFYMKTGGTHSLTIPPSRRQALSKMLQPEWVAVLDPVVARLEQLEAHVRDADGGEDPPERLRAEVEIRLVARAGVDVDHLQTA